MANQFDEFMEVLKALYDEEVDYILIGGVAVILHGLGRLTRDIDIFVSLNPKNIENLKQALYSIFKDNSIEEITLKELENYPVIRYGTPQGFYIDIMARIGEAFEYEDLEYEIIDYHGVKIKLGTPETLYKLKKDTIRHQDKADASFLKELIKIRRSDKIS